MAVNLVYLVLIVILLALLTWGGVGLIGQVQNLVNAIQDYTKDLPAFIASLPHKVYVLGPLRFDLSTIDWQTIATQVISYVEPALGKIGGLVGSLAGSAVSVLGWTAFVVVVRISSCSKAVGCAPGSSRWTCRAIPRPAPPGPETVPYLECLPARPDHHLLFKGDRLYDRPSLLGCPTPSGWR
jgi:hypothetical protein